jgi:photosystem II stability/assembly factor-like uncharacterized protein
MRNYYYLLSFLVISSAAMVILQIDQSKSSKLKMSKKERIEGAIEYNKFTSSDVDLGVIPYDKLLKAIDEAQKRIAAPSRSRSMPGSISNPVWRERGPSNRGGRTRAIMIDESDLTRNRIWIGGVSGGVWRTEDITLSNPEWTKLGIYFESLAISDIAQDPNDFNRVYISTGESYTGDVEGTGIFITEDDGETFTLLPSTNNNTFKTVNEVHVHTNGDVYAATAYGGLFRSRDRGASWQRILGSGISGANSNNFHDFIYTESNQSFYTSNDNSIYTSSTGDSSSWVSIGRGKPGFPNNVNRIEMAVCPSDPGVIYCIGAVGAFSSSTFVSNNGGESWSAKTEPEIFFDYGQAWYDLDIQTDPFNCLRLLAGGVVMAESSFQGLTWSGVAFNMHSDHHNITFDPKKQGRVLYGNDGGIWLSENGGISSIDKSFGYVTTQFYAGAIHPDAGSSYVMGGTQDNNSLIISEAGLSPSRVALGGDGVFCFIDEDNPDIQIVSSQNGNYALSTDGGISFGAGASIDGAFINRSGYDDKADILYGQVNQGGVSDVDFFRWNVKNFQVDIVDISNANVNVTAVKADPNEPNRVYFGGQNGLVMRVDNANSPGTSKPGTTFADLPGTASVSCIYMDAFSSQDALISLFNYGVGLKNIWVTYDGGSQWVAIEGDLPDVPVRWALFDPSNHDKAMIATDAGVWTTDDINGDLTHWEPTNPDNGMPFVRVDMLLLRDSDKVVLGATYGRGLMTSDIFSAPAAVIQVQPIAYQGLPVIIDGTQSVNAQNYEWNLGDNTISNDAVINHQYANQGTYTITLKINGELTTTKKISILPYLPAPYQVDGNNYAGDFETQPDHFAAYTVQGTGFQRGVSTKPGKDGANSGTNAWVLGINDNVYQKNTRAELYTPLYDMQDPGLYELKFFTKYAVQNRNDGFQVEYSVDAGYTWDQLGTNTNTNWYNYLNANLSNGAFPMGYSYFTNAQLNYVQYIKDISFLVGEPTVSFRFVFRSDNEEEAPGVAIDDIQITKYEGELKTTVTAFNAEYTGDQEITINWTTGIEYQCQEFLLERSYTGFGFTQVSNTPAKSGISTFATEYSRVDQSLRDVIYYRLKVINANDEIGYAYDFYTDTIVVRRDAEPDIVNEVLPNPFADFIGISFSSIVDKQIIVRLYDISGKLIVEEITIPHAVSYQLDRLNLPTGVYVMSVQIGEGEIKTYKLFTNGGQ